MPAQPSLLFVIGGGDDDDQIRREGSHIVVTGTSDLTKLLLDREPHDRLHVTRNFFRQSRTPDLSAYRTIVNLITEPELNAKVLENLKKLLRGFRGSVINKPEAVLRTGRDQVARLLSGVQGMVVPRTVRLPGGKRQIAAKVIEKAGIVPPIIVRQAGAHTGKSVGQSVSLDDAVSAIEGSKDHFATQFVDYASADGLYRKYRVYFMGPHVVLRHMCVSDHWNVHGDERISFMANHPDLVAEERGLFESDDPFGPKVREVFRAVRERMPLDYFGMDFGFTRDGQVLLFEANATMTFFPLWRNMDPQFEYLVRCLDPAVTAFRELLGLPPETGPMAKIQVGSL